MAKKDTKESNDKELEELEKQIEEEKENPDIKDTPPEEEEETPEEKPEEEQPVEEVEEEEETEEETPEEKEPEKEEEPDYKNKFSESSREVQRINAKNRRLTKAIADLSDISEPTDEEMAQEYEDWDVMSQTEQKNAKEIVINRRWRERLTKENQEAEKIVKWGEDVDKFVDDPKTIVDYPELDGKEEAFKEFASKDENNNVSFSTLVGAFLYQYKGSQVKHKGQMFPTGQGGDKEKRQRSDGKISFEEGEKLKQTNFKKWQELLRADKIADPEL